MSVTEKVRELRTQRLKDYRKLFSSDVGKRVLNDLIAQHYVMSSTYVRGDALDMAFREGQRNVILRIMSVMNYDAEKVDKMIKESNEHVRTQT